MDDDSANSALTPAIPGNVWQKGMASPNPSGRPALAPEVKEMLKARTIDAVTALVEIMTSPDAKPADRIRAAEAFLDRALGKAPQSVSLSGPDGQPVQLDLRGALLAAVGKLSTPPDEQ